MNRSAGFAAADPPLVSVVMSVYNGAPHLEEAIDSILGQTHSRLELVVTDDGSTDDSAAIIRACAARDVRVRPLFLPHSGIGRADNAGVRAARGDWIARMDQDDVALPRRIEVQLEYARASGAEICGSQAEVFGSAADAYRFPESHESIRRAFCVYIAVLQPTVLAKARILKENPYQEEMLAADYELWTRLIPHRRFANVPEVLLKYRTHDGQTTRKEQNRFVGDMLKLRFRYFYSLYPGTPWADFIAFYRATDTTPLTSLDEVERAGRWFQKIFGGQADDLRTIMAGRWGAMWSRSSNLGPDGETVFRRYLDALKSGPNGD